MRRPPRLVSAANDMRFISVAMSDCDLAQVLYEEKKLMFDSMMAGLESSKSKLESEVRALREEVSSKESRYHYLQMMIAMMRTQVSLH